MSEDVANQKHYTKNEIEPIDYIVNVLTPEELRGYYWGNVIKYISRWKEKGGVEDLKKAQVYLGWWVELEAGIKCKELLITTSSVCLTPTKYTDTKIINSSIYWNINNDGE